MISELLVRLLRKLEANPYTDRANRQFYAANEMTFFLQELSISTCFTADERAKLKLVADAFSHAGDIPEHD